MDVLQFLSDLKIQPTAMIDVSDGLSSDLMHIAKQSMLGCDIYENKIPLAPDTIRVAADFGLDPLTCALNGGEDYELLFTITQTDYEKIKGSPHFSIIGHMTEESTGCRLITKSNEAFNLQAQGWQAFKE